MKKRGILIFIILLYGGTRLQAQWPNPLPGKGSQLTISMIKDWMYLNGEIASAASSLSLRELVEFSHLKDKAGPYSVSSFWNYSIEPHNDSSKVLVAPLKNGMQNKNRDSTFSTRGSLTLFNADVSSSKLINAKVDIYPNPFTDYFHLQFINQFLGKKEIVIYLLASDGRRIRQVFKGMTDSGKGISLRVDGSALTKGLYYLEVVSGTGQKFVSKVIRQ